MSIEDFAKFLGVSIEKATAISYIFSGCGFTEDQCLAIAQVIIELNKKE